MVLLQKLDTGNNTNTPLTRNTPLTLMDNGLMQTIRFYRSVLRSFHDGLDAGSWKLCG
ncbi:hypothetical protein K435DRAFT_524732 [Dendrothele bispora CBS 962.96]|uniref:Uncharacterized protein n=1 Tax=Dendrothele bispora (strain CBS 962.96) TaxID=1314807 RepID=A0A4S8M8J5_DENBC|nr:hypothetical protein K435DRAFT_524732 [Dendrothele bispora CBS 962.96]